MIEPAPYTRETIDRIRKGAKPTDLGWMSAFYLSVCKKHGIEPIGVGPLTVSVQVTMPPPIMIAVRAIGDVTWNPKTGELSRDGLRISLPSSVAEIFDELYVAAKRGAGFISTEAMGSIDLNRSSICKAAARFNRLAFSLNLRIESRFGKGGGYRLVDLCNVASASVNSPKQEN